jgi:hypothetical protein
MRRTLHIAYTGNPSNHGHGVGGARSSNHKKYAPVQDTIFEHTPAEIRLAQSKGSFQNSERQQTLAS